MKVESTRRNRRIVFSTFILSSLILAGGTYLFITVMIPLYNLDQAQIRSVLIRLLPIVTGFLLAVMALAISPPAIGRNSEDEDELERDPFTAPLYVLPDEESHTTLTPILEPVGPSPKQQSIVASTLSEVELPLSGTLGEVTAPARILDTQTIFTMDPPVESSQPAVSSEQPPEEQIREQTIEDKGEDVPRSQLDRQVLFSAYPFPIETGSAIAQLLEPIGASRPVDEEENPSLYLEYDNTFSTRVDVELQYAKSIGYPLSLASLTCDGDDQMQELTGSLSSIHGILYHEDQTLKVILPFLSFEQCREVFTTVFDRIRKQYPENRLSCGYTTFSIHDQENTQLAEQVETALNIAVDHGSYAIIGYDSNSEEE
ncbi:MAG: hypothetical protein JXK93_04440 [Sphaerochaetaceae bacterium]|nr:hypothetical protein [Sphaerochaetaceae bacterium]